MDYDFMTLSPEDFEAVVADLFSREWRTQLELFKPGKDGGIDLRNSRVPADAPKTIVQCRRYAFHKFAELKRSLTAELDNLERLQPADYVLATSVSLSDANKKSLLEILSPWCRGPQNIYGLRELNALLRKHKDVLRAHFKLWMSGTEVLEQILHARIFNITEATVQAVKSEVSRLVMHAGFERARQMLEHNHHCVIAGNPGIGKTTVARMLMCHYMLHGYKPIVVVGDISDAWTVVNQTAAELSKYVILYDDFLGTFRFDEAKFAKNEDTSLMRFIDKSSTSPNLRLILTTRELVLADARRLHGAFERQADQLAKCTILLEDYARANRAKVLFNHLYFSDLPDARLAMLLCRRVYRDIVGHEHFNPRIVETISKAANSLSLSDEEFCEYVRSRFDDPSDLWEHPFENQISPVARQTLAVLWSFSGATDLETLREAVFSLNDEREPTDLALRFRSGLKELTGNFISCNWHDNAVPSLDRVLYVTFQNPSVQEFIERFLSREKTWTDSLARSVTRFRQLERLESWARPNHHRKETPVSSAFFHLLHSKAGSVEHAVAGAIHRFVGSAEPKFLNSDLRNLVERTHVLLRIAAASAADDEQARKLWTRVTTADGWKTLLTDARWNSGIARATRRLVEWLQAACGSDQRYKLAKESFLEVGASLLGDDEEWESRFRALDDLCECLALLQDERLPDRIASVERLLSKVSQDWIAKEENSYQLEEEASALSSIRARGASVPSELPARLQARVSELHQKEDTKGDTGLSEARYNSTDEPDTFDLDGLFLALLDR